jgi:hypothetical protein
MPWTPSQAHFHTHKAKSPHAKAVWAKIADTTLHKTGDEGRSIREANAVIARMKHKK